ncbi:hypothetical protein M9Y10_009274 [Tritrichomonas musculus]|uniref:AAA+ ATPase domain-containing protein n=1 Tax=Tritrichomonas musculus TaxID=1915356 RepID=A0ABR2IN43_9EUKA
MSTAAQKKYYEAIGCLKTAKDAEQFQNIQLAISNYSNAISKARSALQGQLTEPEKKASKELIERSNARIQELQSFIISNPSINFQQSRKQSSSLRPVRSRSQQRYQPAQVNHQQYQQSAQQQQEANLSMNSAILQERPNIKFSDVAGLTAAKQALTEAVLLPVKIPALFQGPTQPWKGILLYGPPGTGKSYLAKAVAGEANNSTFLTVSTAELTSKWVGESEKLIKSLFETARQSRPSVIFIDEIDSLVSARNGDNESESGRRIKTEFLIQMDGVSSDNKGVLLIAATNLPWALDPAMRRRFEKRIYVPLPDSDARLALIQGKLKDASHSLTNQDIRELAQSTEGFSGADISILVRDALMQPIREFQQSKYFVQKKGLDMNGVKRDGLWVACTKSTRGAKNCSWDELPANDIMRPIAGVKHFRKSIMKVRPSVSKSDLKQYEKWTKDYGEDGT